MGKRNFRMWPINQQFESARLVCDADALSMRPFVPRFNHDQLLARLIGAGGVYFLGDGAMVWREESDDD